MPRVLLLFAIGCLPAFSELANPSLYCGHFGSRNRITERLECAVGPHQYSLEAYPFDLSNYYVEEVGGNKVEGVLTRDAYTITFVAKKPFTAKKKYRLKINLTALNREKKIKLQLSWNKKNTGIRHFCFEGMETLEDSGYENRPERDQCQAKP